MVTVQKRNKTKKELRHGARSGAERGPGRGKTNKLCDAKGKESIKKGCEE